MGNRPSVELPVVLDTLQNQACASTSSTEKMTSHYEDKEVEVESKELTGDTKKNMMSHQRKPRVRQCSREVEKVKGRSENVQKQRLWRT